MTTDKGPDVRQSHTFTRNVVACSGALEYLKHSRQIGRIYSLAGILNHKDRLIRPRVRGNGYFLRSGRTSKLDGIVYEIADDLFHAKSICPHRGEGIDRHNGMTCCYFVGKRIEDLLNQSVHIYLFDVQFSTSKP